MSFKRTIIASRPLDELPGYENRLVKLEFPPGCVNPPHTHPSIGLGYIISGEHDQQWEGEEITHHKTGDVILDRAHERHILTSNASQTEPLVIILSYVIKIGQPNVEMI